MPPQDPKTFSEFLALPLAKREALNQAWLEAAIAVTEGLELAFLAGDHDRLGSYRRFELGE